MNLPPVSIVIPTYNRANSLSLTMQSFFALDYPKDRYEVVVADNNSTDSTKSVIQQYQAKAPVPVHYLMESRQGVHYARNSAAKAAHFDLLYYTDDDMTADPQLLRSMVAALGIEPRIACVGGRVLPIWEATPPEWVLTLCSNGLLSLSNRTEHLIISPTDPGVFSCHQLLRRSALFQAGGFNPENTAGEWIGDGETGLNLKIQAQGDWFAYVRDAIIYHRIPRQRMTLQYLVKRYVNQGSSDSYGDYRRYRPTDVELTMKLLCLPRKLLIELVLCALHFVQRKPAWRIHWARVFYHFARFRYDIRLLRNAEWRHLVVKTNWITP